MRLVGCRSDHVHVNRRLPSIFFAEDLPDLLDAICRAAYKFDAHYWRNVSNEAKDFIKSLIVTDPSKRPTAKECMRSSWYFNCYFLDLIKLLFKKDVKSL